MMNNNENEMPASMTTAEMEEWFTAEDELLLSRAKAEYEANDEPLNVLEQHHTWAVTDYGMECLWRFYPIEKAQLVEEHWPIHMSSHTWVNMSDFLQCFYAARHHHYPERYRSSYPTTPGRQRRPKADANSRRQLSPQQRFLILRRDGYRCQICGRSAEDGVKLHVDHKRAVALGGGNDNSNLWTLCGTCNAGKGTQSLT